MSRSTMWLVTLAPCLVASCGGAETAYEKTDGGKSVAAAPGELHAIDFDDASAGSMPSSFVNVLGDWEVRDDGDAPSGARVFAQTGTFEDAESAATTT